MVAKIISVSKKYHIVNSCNSSPTEKKTLLVGADISTVSKHLTVLKKAGLVESEKRGLQVFYTLLSPCVMNFFTCVESVIEAHKEQESRSAT